MPMKQKCVLFGDRSNPCVRLSMVSLADFEIELPPIGSGSFGTVYRARRNSDGKKVCIKCIQLFGATSTRMKQTLHEAEMLSTIHSEHIIDCYGSFIEKDVLYIVMEYAECGSLEALIAVRFHFVKSQE